MLLAFLLSGYTLAGTSITPAKRAANAATDFFIHPPVYAQTK